MRTAQGSFTASVRFAELLDSQRFFLPTGGGRYDLVRILAEGRPALARDVRFCAQVGAYVRRHLVMITRERRLPEDAGDAPDPSPYGRRARGVSRSPNRHLTCVILPGGKVTDSAVIGIPKEALAEFRFMFEAENVLIGNDSPDIDGATDANFYICDGFVGDRFLDYRTNGNALLGADCREGDFRVGKWEVKIIWNRKLKDSSSGTVGDILRRCMAGINENGFTFEFNSGVDVLRHSGANVDAEVCAHLGSCTLLQSLDTLLGSHSACRHVGCNDLHRCRRTKSLSDGASHQLRLFCSGSVAGTQLNTKGYELADPEGEEAPCGIHEVFVEPDDLSIILGLFGGFFSRGDCFLFRPRRVQYLDDYRGRFGTALGAVWCLCDLRSLVGKNLYGLCFSFASGLRVYGSHSKKHKSRV
jgi:hypothetical protein